MKRYSVILNLVLLVCLAACVSQAPQPTVTPVPSNIPTETPTQTPTSTSTSTPTQTPTRTSTPNLSATAKAATAFAAAATSSARMTAEAAVTQKALEAENKIWNQLKEDGVVTMEKGALVTPSDFKMSWAQRNWYQWEPVAYNYKDFVILTHIQWESAAPLATSGNGGCGFVVRLIGTYTHMVVYLKVGNSAELGGQSKASGWYLKSPSWQLPKLKTTTEQKGEADFWVIAQKEKITVYIDGVKSYTWFVSLLSSGDIGYTVLSGTNRDFGTWCKMANTRIWELVK